ncbi:MAG: hypothetical protein M1836_000240 [Candelina mexicana]|nr:MAG: hypothetical protein M1836_000240 [Candelina mexicana]
MVRYAIQFSPENSHSEGSTACATSYAPTPEAFADPLIPRPATAEILEENSVLGQQLDQNSKTHVHHNEVLESHSFDDKDDLSFSQPFPALYAPASVEANTRPRKEAFAAPLTQRPKAQRPEPGTDTKPSHIYVESASSSDLGLKGRAEATITPRLIDKKVFLSVWLGQVLPHLDKTLPAILGSSFTVDLFRDRSSNCGPSRAIHVTSPCHKPPDMQEKIRNGITEVLPEFIKHDVHVLFFDGAVERLCHVRGVDEECPDMICEPQWTRYLKRPSMGASIGSNGGPDTATLGGYLMINEEYHILTVHHLFEEEKEPGEGRIRAKLIDTMLTQPSGPDMKTQCTTEHAYLGRYINSSGYGQRHSTSLPMEMDWALCSVRNSRVGLNVVPERDEVQSNADPSASAENPYLPAPAYLPNRFSDQPCRIICDELSDIPVHCMARTSGYQIGLTSEGPSLVNYSNGRPSTYEWVVMRDNDFQTDSQWVSRGVGLSGDSGAWILRREDNAVCGMVWGRSKPYGPDERKAYFTPMSEIFGDIAKTLEIPEGYIQLPQGLPSPSCNSSEAVDMDLEDVLDPRDLVLEDSVWRSSLYSPGGVTEDTMAGSPVGQDQPLQDGYNGYSFQGLDATLMGGQFPDESLTLWASSGMEAELKALEREGLDRCSTGMPQSDGRKRRNKVTEQSLVACEDCISTARNRDLLLSALQKLKAGDVETELHLSCMLEELQASKAMKSPLEHTLSEVVGNLRSNKRQKINNAALEEGARLLFPGS